MNEFKLFVPKYNPKEGISLNWDDEAEIEVRIEDKEVLLFANKEGLISLANLLLNLSQIEIPSGRHIHLDSYDSLEEGSNGLIIGKK